jgi:hypothetical protein
MAFRLQSIALTAALVGFNSADAAGCYPTYSSGAKYAINDWVSATKTTTNTVTERCDVGSSGCGSNGFKVTTTTATSTNNYQCTNAAWCSQAAYDPAGQYSGQTWTKQSGQCTGAAGSVPAVTPPPVPAPAAWSGGGCPDMFAAGAAYDSGDLVYCPSGNPKGTYNMVYKCKDGASSGWCGTAGYEPGDSQYWAEAWEALGSCSGTIAPTTSPVYKSIASAGGCPEKFSASAVYEEGDTVNKDGLVYECKAGGASGWCSMSGYEPGEGVTQYWKEAWTVKGYCSGTIAPSTSPVWVSLTNMGGCPDKWSLQTYEEGDKVSKDGLLYTCKSYPQSGHCGQAGYEPQVDSGTSGAWKMAWTLSGYCSGSTGPTSSPSFDPVKSVGACGPAWSSGSNVAYEEGDMVSVTVSTTPVRKVAYKCKSWPLSGHCGQYSPEDKVGGALGWTLAGSCGGTAGTIGPTSSPTFDDLVVNTAGCPKEYSSSSLTYVADDLVALTVSSSPERKIVYKCRPWPSSGYCNQAGFKPNTRYGEMAWIVVGACSGTIAPTQSPVAYNGTCTYQKNEMINGNSTCAIGETGCVCTYVNGTATSCVKSVQVAGFVTASVDNWSSTTVYNPNDVVRVNKQRYKCKASPYYASLWCRQAAYKPDGKTTGIWGDAWSMDGMCP